MIFDNGGEQTKNAQKGINKTTKLTYQSYIDTLYDNRALIIPQKRMQFNKKVGSMAIIEQNKAGLNPIFTKLRVHDDMISISPLCKDGKFI